MVHFRFVSCFLLPVLSLFSLSARASPHSRIAPKLAVKRINLNGAKSIADADRARVKALLAGSGSSPISVLDFGTGYIAEIGVGIPPTYYTLLIDTGSSNTWIGATQPYVQTSTSQDTGDTFSVTYAAGNTASGEEYLDTVTISPVLVIQGQSIGVAAHGSDAGYGQYYLDGILGLGPADLTEGNIRNTDEAPTVLDNLYTQATISSEVLGVFFAPVSEPAASELMFGGYDSSRLTGDIDYAPITSAAPASDFWGVDQSISYGTTSIMSEASGIVDIGTTIILLSTDAFNAYQAATGATLDDHTNFLMISSEQYDNLSSLYFNIGGVSYELTPNAQIWPRSLNYNIGGTPDGIYLIVNDLGSVGDFGFDSVLGYCFIQRYYAVFDATNSQVGFAATEFTYSTSN